jgi:chromosome segregation and condensation protein ScpB
MNPVTRADVEEFIGDASDHLIARIIATGDIWPEQ